MFESLFGGRAAFPELAPAAAAAALATYQILDVREPSEFNDALGHVPGAKLVPLGTVGAAAATLDRAAKYLVVCRSGGRSGRACGQLAGLGFDVTNLAGGMMAWNTAGLPTERS